MHMHTPRQIILAHGYLLQGLRGCAEVQGGSPLLRQHISLGTEGQQQLHTVSLGSGTGLMQGSPASNTGIQLSSLQDQVAGAVCVASGRSDGEGYRLLGLGCQYPEP